MKYEGENYKLNIDSIESISFKNEFKIRKKVYLIFFLFFVFIFIIIIINNKINILITNKSFDITKNSNFKRNKIPKSDEESLDSIFKDDTNIDYLMAQKDFCVKQNNIQNINEKIQLVKADYYNVKFNMFVYKGKDIVSNFILRNKCWDPEGSKSMLDSLEFYRRKKNLNIQDIYILDLGANIGWYSLFLGKLGYNLIAFEPSIKNYQILKKNYCLNQDMNITIINKGIYIENKNCSLYHQLSNIGNAFLICDEQKFIKKNYFEEKIKLTKLSNYIPFLSNKNLAIIKIDVEGSEGIAVESGIDLIKKYHVPFIHLEFSPSLLRNKKTDPQLFLEMFEKNGYKFSKVDFLSKNYSSIAELLKARQINIFIIYTKFLDY